VPLAAIFDRVWDRNKSRGTNLGTILNRFRVSSSRTPLALARDLVGALAGWVAAGGLLLAGGFALAETSSDDLPAVQRYVVTLAETGGAASKVAAGKALIAPASVREMADTRQMMALMGASVMLELPKQRAMAVMLTQSQLEVMQQNPAIASIERDSLRHMMADEVPFGIPLVQANQVAFGGDPGFKICMVDSGFDLGHPDLPSGIRVTGESAPGIGPWFEDGSGHGTHVSGTVMAMRNDEGVIGVVPEGNFDVHIFRVFNDLGEGVPSSTVVAGVQACVDSGARVVNMSLGCAGADCFSSFEQNAFANFEAQGILAVAAAGNEGDTQVSFPAAYPSVVAVAAVDEFSARASFSQQFAEVELAGPGVAVRSTVPRGTGFGGFTSVADQAFTNSPLVGSAVGDVSGLLADCGLAGELCENVSGRICLIERGTFLFSEKALNCQNGGGLGAIIYNNVPGEFSGTLGTTPIAIPVVGVSDQSGIVLLTQLNQTASVSVGVQDYGLLSGTSMATPHVSGVAALIWSLDPSLTNLEVRAALQQGAVDLGAPGRDPEFGFGLVQAAASVAVLPSDTDGDGVLNPNDNCVSFSNASQADSDADGQGDGCDTDSDNDALPDAFELANGLSVVTNDALGDADNDGFSNITEFYAGTSATDAASLPQVSAVPQLAAAVLPTSRSAVVGQPITAFATLINTSTTTARNCTLSPVQGLPAEFQFFATSAVDNSITGQANQPIDIVPNGSQTFLFSLEPTAEFDPIEMGLWFSCENLGTAAQVEGLTSLLVGGSNTPTPDLVALASTASGDGVLSLDADIGGAFAMAAVNIGTGGTFNVTAEAGDALPVTLTLCETDAASNCVDAAGPQSVISLTLDAGATPTLAVFAQATGPIVFDPANNRVRVQFVDGEGVVRGATSVAIQAP